MLNKDDIFPIAIGTYGLGANRTETHIEEESFDINSHLDELDSLMYSFNCGQNYIETSFIYGGGQTMKFLRYFFEKIPRDRIFITVKIEKYIEKIEDIEAQLDKYLNIMGLEYADSILLHAPKVSKIPLEDCYKELNRLVYIGKSRYISASNLNIEQLKSILEEMHINLFSFEGLFNLECKANEDVGIIDYCKKNNILFINYQPLRRNRTASRNYTILIELSKKYNKTKNQILLNWMIKEKKLIPIVKSSKIENINLNIDSLNFNMSKQDYELLNSFRSEEFDSIEVDWDDDGGVPIYKFANQFD